MAGTLRRVSTLEKPVSSETDLTLHPIGRVVCGRKKGARDDCWEDQVAEIEIDARWAEALDGIEGFSHIWVLWWLDLAGGPPDSPRVHPEGRDEMPLVGFFATRSPRRPNPIAMTVVHLREREESRLRVDGLDAYEDTPILDIKPYLKRGDLIPEAASPGWLERLWHIHDEDRAAST
jgi:tRNA-Thr(GGU) m(6)t(6)A37 methyltransferase TsaA